MTTSPVVETIKTQVAANVLLKLLQEASAALDALYESLRYIPSEVQRDYLATVQKHLEEKAPKHTSTHTAGDAQLVVWDKFEKGAV